MFSNLNNTLILSLDVESMGLYGTPFSYGYVLANLDGKVLEERYVFSSKSLSDAIELVSISDFTQEAKSYSWVFENVLMVANQPNSDDNIINCFVEDYLTILDKYNNYSIYLLADHPYPVETNFLNSVLLNINSNVDIDIMKYSPYPLLDLANLRMSRGLEPEFERLDNELPKHHPLMDARQTLRGFLNLVNGINN